VHGLMLSNPDLFGTKKRTQETKALLRGRDASRGLPRIIFEAPSDVGRSGAWTSEVKNAWWDNTGTRRDDTASSGPRKRGEN